MTTSANEVVWVRWNGHGRHAFPYPPGKEVELHRGFNKISRKMLDAITGGIDSEGRARGGTGAAYWNAKPPLLSLGREPMPDEEFHTAVERVGVTKSRKTLRREAERTAVEDLRTMVIGLQAQVLALRGGGELPAGSTAEASQAEAQAELVLAEAKRELEETRVALGERERELEDLRAKAQAAADLEAEAAELREEAQTARAEAAELTEELEQATAPAKLLIDPSSMTLKQLDAAIAAEGVSGVDLSRALTQELGREGGPRTGAVEALTKAIAGGV